MFERHREKRIEALLDNFPAVSIVGPRQCGKSTLAKRIVSEREGAVYLDLENPDDRARLSEPTLYLPQYSDRLVCLDEVQFAPEIFGVLRSLIDSNGHNGRFLLLGSASPNLLRQSSESLAGRIAYVELTPLTLPETMPPGNVSLEMLWLRGGFPRSLLMSDEDMSMEWRRNFIRTFLERDLAAIGPAIAPESMRRLWMMLAHTHGQPLNLSSLANSLGVSHTTVRNHIDLLVGTFMLRRVEAHHANIEKRIRKAPKTYISDSGILHALLGIESMDDLLAHPVAGFSWEGFVLQQVTSLLSEWQVTQVTTSNQAEIDFLLSRGRKTVAVECKLSRAPRPARGFHTLMEDLRIDQGFVISPVNESFPLSDRVTVARPEDLVKALL
jgi:uncharacterized protein